MDSHTTDRSVLSSEAGKLLQVLLAADETGRVQISTKHLMRESGLTEGALMRARDELTRSDLLRIEPGFRANGLRGANFYVLNMLALDPSKGADAVTAEPVVEGVLEGPEGAPAPSAKKSLGRKGFLGFFRKGDKAS